MCSAICHQHSITSGGITLACDNLMAGRSIQRTLYYPNPTWDHFDVLQAIFRLRHALPIKVRYKHVEGHQSKKYPSQKLDQWAILNEKMDALAKAYLSHSNDYPALSEELSPKEWYVSLQGKKVCRQLKTTLDH